MSAVAERGRCGRVPERSCPATSEPSESGEFPDVRLPAPTLGQPDVPVAGAVPPPACLARCGGLAVPPPVHAHPGAVGR